MNTHIHFPIALRRLLAVQTQVAFNDNAAKLMLILLALTPGILPEGQGVLVVGLLTVLLVLPFVLFSPIAGWLADRYSKRSVLQAGLGMQLGAMAVLSIGIWAQSMAAAVAGFALLALQSALFSPAKRGILKELAAPGRLPVAVGWMEMLTISAILVGSLSGSLAFDLLTRATNNPWAGALVVSVALTVASLLSWLFFQAVPRTTAQSTAPYRANLWWHQFASVAELWRERELFRVGLGGTFFYSLGGLLYLTLVQVAGEAHSGGVGTGSFTALLLGCLGIGAATGHLVAGHLCRGRTELGFVPLGAFGIATGLLVMAFSAAGSTMFLIGLGGMGFAGGLFLVPLHAFLQEHAKDERRGRVLAAINIMESLGGILASGLYVVMARYLGFSASTQLMVMLIPTLLVGIFVARSMPANVTAAIARIIVSPFYRIRIRGLENVPATGGAIVIANHFSYADAVLLQLSFPRRLRFLGAAGLVRNRWLNKVFDLFGVIPVSSNNALSSLKTAIEHVKAGEIVCIFPEGGISRTGMMQELKEGFAVIARKSGAPVIPVWMDQLWGSIFSFHGGRFFSKLPKSIPYRIGIEIGQPIAPDSANVDSARQALLDLSHEAFQQRPEINDNLGRCCIKALRRCSWRTAIADHTSGRRLISRAKLLAASCSLAMYLRKEVKEPRVGIVLPPGIAGSIANLGVVLAGKVPVNLNFTAPCAAIEFGINQAGIKTVLTASAMQAKLRDFPWPADTLDLPSLLLGRGKTVNLLWLLGATLLPTVLLSRLLKLPSHGGDAEAGLLFTSGSSGTPKGVPLTHRNILANVHQVEESEVLISSDTILASLPLFHSFGFTVTIWTALLRGVRITTVPTPLDTRKIAAVISTESATVHVATPTFLRSLLKQAEPHQLQSLRLIISGAERLPEELSEAFASKFGTTILQGYGLTETSPVATISVPHSPAVGPHSKDQTGWKSISVGRLAAGMSARILNPDTMEELPLSSTGLLCLRGTNVFNGYLGDNSPSPAYKKEEWFITGDLARFDADNFLIIEGRLSRFSKIGGEMVPLGLVEETILKAFDLTEAEHPAAVVTSIPCPDKGETLVLLCTTDIKAEELRQRLAAAKLPNLWIPRHIHRIERIPVLGSGKLDLSACRLIATQNTIAA